MGGLLRGIALVFRFNYKEKNQMYFCNAEHAMLWKEKLGKRFIRWQKKPA